MSKVGKVVAVSDGRRMQMPKKIKTLLKNQRVYRPELKSK